MGKKREVRNQHFLTVIRNTKKKQMSNLVHDGFDFGRVEEDLEVRDLKVADADAPANAQNKIHKYVWELSKLSFAQKKRADKEEDLLCQAVRLGLLHLAPYRRYVGDSEPRIVYQVEVDGLDTQLTCKNKGNMRE